MTICILGRQPRLGMAELEALFGADSLQPLGSSAALIEVDAESITHAKLGGAIKVAKLVTTLHTTNWREIAAHLQEQLPAHLEYLPEGKLTLGLSAYGLHVRPKDLERTALELKKLIKQSGRPVRIVPNKEIALNSAQVLHNNLTETLGIELMFVAHAGRTYIAQTVSVQDVESYSKRDFGRPKRDAFVGMLPPKLAQMMINLAQPPKGATILDPFCGTGVVLMEAVLHGYAVEGSDLSQKMIDYSRANLQWLSEAYHITPEIRELVQGDATDHTWRKPIDAVVCETYLGQPLSGLPSRQKLDEIVRNCNAITRKFLINLHHQLAKDARCTIAVPAWRVGGKFIHLPVIDDLKKIGYNRVSFSCADTSDLIYHRPDQIVARELLVLTVQ